jgi:hypothetical protein
MTTPAQHETIKLLLRLGRTDAFTEVMAALKTLASFTPQLTSADIVKQLTVLVVERIKVDPSAELVDTLLQRNET